MAVMLEKVYRAFRAANVPEKEAGEAAAELAGYESRFTSLESDMRLLKWMVGFNLAVSVAILFKVFS